MIYMSLMFCYIIPPKGKQIEADFFPVFFLNFRYLFSKQDLVNQFYFNALSQCHIEINASALWSARHALLPSNVNKKPKQNTRSEIEEYKEKKLCLYSASRKKRKKPRKNTLRDIVEQIQRIMCLLRLFSLLLWKCLGIQSFLFYLLSKSLPG